MKKVFFTLLSLSLLASLAWSKSAKPVKVIYQTRVDTSPPLTELAKNVPPPGRTIEVYEVPNNEPPIEPAA